MKHIDSNQLRIIDYLLEHGSGKHESLMPLVHFDDDKVDAYLSVMSKLKTMGIVGTELKNGRVTFSLTGYGRDNFTISTHNPEDNV